MRSRLRNAMARAKRGIPRKLRSRFKGNNSEECSFPTSTWDTLLCRRRGSQADGNSDSESSLSDDSEFGELRG